MCKNVPRFNISVQIDETPFIKAQHQTDWTVLPEHDVHVVAAKRSDACHASLRRKSAVDEGNGMKHGE